MTTKKIEAKNAEQQKKKRFSGREKERARRAEVALKQVPERIFFCVAKGIRRITDQLAKIGPERSEAILERKKKGQQSNPL